MNRAHFLLDVNVLIALTDKKHVHHELTTDRFNEQLSQDWGICAFTETGFVRVVTRSTIGALSVREATEILKRLAAHPGYKFWAMTETWSTITAPIKNRIFGHQQITDAYLVGLAIKENGILVTLDKALSHLAGREFSRNVLTLE